MYKKIVLLTVILMVISCQSSKPAIVTKKYENSKYKKDTRYTSNKKTSATKKETTETIVSTSKTVVTTDVINGYIYNYKDIAMSNMKNYGIPASIILAQAILESGAGQGRLAQIANNHFGVKCYTDWTGDTTNHDDDSSQECFRKYKDPDESFQDHAKIVSKRTRYASLFKLSKDDYKGWARGLKAAGYATDPRYPEKLISYIERYHLDEYDNKVLGKNYTFDKNQMPQRTIDSKKGADEYEVKKGDTLYSISKKYNITVEELRRQNKIDDNAISIGQIIQIK